MNIKKIIENEILTKNKNKIRNLKNKFENYSNLINLFIKLDIPFNQKVYLLYNDIKDVPKCVCGNNTIFFNFSKGYSKYCSKKCSYSKERTLKIKKTKKERYNNETYVNPKKAIKTKKEKYENNYYDLNKFKETSLKKYGEEHPMKSKKIKEKLKKNMFKKYGVGHNWQLKKSLKKRINVIKEKYGENGVLGNKKVREKIKKTNLKKYGVENSLQSKEIQEKIKQTNLKKYGVNNPMKTNKIKAKKNETIRNKMFKKYNNLKNYKALFTENEFINTHYSNKYKWQCNKCNTIFEDDLYSGRLPRCPSCYPIKLPIKEKEIVQWLQSLQINIIENDRAILNGKELDIYLPKHNLAIEFNGIYWHSELQGKDFIYHLNKTLLCQEQGIQLLHIFEDEWLDKQDIIKSIILSKLNKYEQIIYARKCVIKEVKNYKDFLNNNHLRGYIGSKINLGLYYQDQLVSLLTLSKPRYNKKYDYEILRFCNLLNTKVIGGFSKLLKYFENNYSGSIITYSDKRLFDGSIYRNNRFTELTSSDPNYYYTDYKSRYSRIKFQKHKLKEQLKDYDSTLTEWENMQLNGWDRIWDCGNYIFIMES